MAISTESVPSRTLSAPRSSRPVEEVVVRAFFAPVADVLVRALVPVRLAPPALVVVHTLVGLLAAGFLKEGALVVAALLLQLKTLLDNADGRLARVSGRVTLLGRYLDTEADLVVNAVLLATVASATGEPVLALVSFLALTLMLGVDFNVSVLFAEARGEAAPEPALTGGMLERILALGYRAVFAPQDRVVRRFAERRLAHVLAGESDPGRVRAATLAYHDRTTAAVLANLGLSTQLAVLGACLVLGAPEVYLWLVLGSLVLLPVLQLRRERRAAKALGG